MLSFAFCDFANMLADQQSSDADGVALHTTEKRVCLPVEVKPPRQERSTGVDLAQALLTEGQFTQQKLPTSQIAGYLVRSPLYQSAHAAVIAA